MPLPPMLDPATFATLVSTLGPAGALSQLEAQQVEQQKALQQATTQATQQASQAGQQYSQAAAAPVQDVSALDQFLPQLLGGIASVVSQDPAYRQHAISEIGTQRKNLMQARLDNLSALKESWDKKAQIAQHAGDLENEIKARQTSEKLSKLSADMLLTKQGEQATKLQDLRGKQEISQIRAQGEEARKLEAMKLQRFGIGGGAAGSAAAVPEAVGNWSNLVESGQAQLHNVPKEIRTPVVNDLASRGSILLSPKVRETINGLSAAESILEQLQANSEQVNLAGPGLGRFKQGAKSLGKGFLQTTEADALFDKTTEGFLATISRATGERGVLTDRDVMRAKRLLPSRFDTKAVAEKKIRQLRAFLEGQRQRTIRNFTTPASKMISDPWRTATLFGREDGKVYARRKSDKRTGWIDLDDTDRSLFEPVIPKEAEDILNASQ